MNDRDSYYLPREIPRVTEDWRRGAVLTDEKWAEFEEEVRQRGTALRLETVGDETWAVHVSGPPPRSVFEAKYILEKSGFSGAVCVPKEWEANSEREWREKLAAAFERRRDE